MEHDNNINEYFESDPNLFRKSNLELPKNMVKKTPISKDGAEKIITFLKELAKDVKNNRDNEESSIR